MKILIMILIVLTGCKSKDEPVVIVDPVHCSDFTEYRKVVDLSKTTYQLSVNTCNSISELVLSIDGVMISATKDVQARYGNDKSQTINYTGDALSFRDVTSISGNAGTLIFDYHYINGDNFITKSTRPSQVVAYIYEGEDGFNSILNDTLYEIVILQAKEAINTL